MRHSVFGRKLSRTNDERKRLFQNLSRDLITRGAVQTTFAKAKAVQPMVEKLVTLAKKGSAKEVEKILASREIEKRFIEDAKTRFAKRASGFTRIVKLGKRMGDATEEAILSFVDEKVETSVTTPKKVTSAPAREEKKPVKRAVRKTITK